MEGGRNLFGKDESEAILKKKGKGSNQWYLVSESRLCLPEKALEERERYSERETQRNTERTRAIKPESE